MTILNYNGNKNNYLSLTILLSPNLSTINTLSQFYDRISVTKMETKNNYIFINNNYYHLTCEQLIMTIAIADSGLIKLLF